MDADKLEEAEERFFIMDAQADLEREEVFSFLAGKYGDSITDYIRKKYTDTPVSSENKATTRPDSMNQGNIPSKEEKPAIAPDFSLLAKYINAGIKLIPTKPSETGNFFQLKKHKGTDQEELIKIDSIQGLQYWLDHGIERFVFIPKEAGFLCMDLDRNHDHGGDGVKDFYTWMKDNGLASIPLFKDIEAGSFPVYTTTASGGIHLYFKCSADLKTVAKLTDNFEIKYNGLNLTAGGSVKNGKPYSLHGELSQAPIIPAPLLLKLSKELSKTPPKPAGNTYGNRYQAKEKTGYTTDQLLDFARKDAGGSGNHDIIFQMATRLKRAGYTESEAISAIENTPEHISRNDQYDTVTCIKSIYR